MFEAIHPNTLLQAKDEDLHQAAQRLIEDYSRDIAASFPGSCFLSEPVSGTKTKLKSVADLTRAIQIYCALQYKE
ncbi:hypothetical protein F7725_019230 [Dissostichus mawsoni]|uniref:Uncharacterized protein n=1 Tax=Dissostichus mawsoni TaxID=36200 RepID=A0A7J5YKL4_DISMA|nr:hypothetical protein F7725_019230 [Dissostichus mawsoni]